MTRKKGIAILGSTGSIGTQALDVIEAYPEYFSLEVITAGKNAELLIEQAKKYQPNTVVITEESLYQQVKDALWQEDIHVYSGSESLCQVVESTEVDTVLTALVGYAGLKPTLRAIEAGKTIALANKETLVVAGELVTRLAREKGVNIYPVDSEHSAIFQCLVGEDLNTIDKVILTASGGPFRGKTRSDLAEVTKAQALKHPNWEMGAKITIDSATLMNKGLEVIEAKWLFGLKPQQIEAVIHPQSIIHSMVEFNDGSIKAQMGLPDMKLPIHYAFFYPNRVPSSFKRMSFTEVNNLTFEMPDWDTFKNLALAYEAMNAGGNMACILNAANEIAVDAFLKDKIKFLQIADLNEACMRKVKHINQPTLDDYVQTDKETREVAMSLI